jgi:DNA helicase-2/ATP-dependent DNA helicase PcrA
MTHPLLTNLNPPQQQAVKIKDGPILILAGAGSGKTRVLTHRIAYLIKYHQVSPHQILAVTFTNKAADEMQKRVNHLMAEANPLPWMGTFHSICVKILRRELSRTLLPYSSSFIILDEQDSLAVIKKIIKELGKDPRRISPRAIKAFISNAKSELMTAKDMKRFTQGPFQELALKIYQEYQDRLEKLNGLDFDDLLMETVKMLKRYPQIKTDYQNLFQYILIDEYQDTNTAQYQLVRLLADKHQNLCVVGDDWQSIYRFRNADFRNILNFEKDYPKAKVIKLEQNYRSTKNILRVAQKIIDQNSHRTDKVLWTNNPTGLPVTLATLRDEKEEACFLISEVKDLKHLGIRSSDCLVLYRTHAQSRAIEKQLKRFGLKYQIIGGVSFYERREVKDVLAYLKLLTHPDDRLSLERISNRPPRGIGPKTLAMGGARLDEFVKLIDRLRHRLKDRTPSETIDLISRATGYKDWLLDGTQEGEERWENVKELKSEAEDFDNLDEFLEKTSLYQAIDKIKDEPSYDGSVSTENKESSLTLMTLHNAKGLEYPIVFITGMEEGLFPHSRSLIDPQEIEEERRLCYVGATRAKQRLYLTHTQRRRIYGSIQSYPPSRFLEDIPKEMMEII